MFLQYSFARFDRKSKNLNSKKGKKMVHPAGFEPTTFCSGVERSKWQKWHFSLKIALFGLKIMEKSGKLW
jgi:hypothetical protein